MNDSGVLAMTPTRGRRVRGWRRGQLLFGAVAAFSVIVVACTTGATVTPVPTTLVPPADDAFTVVFVGDSEARMRGNTNAEVVDYVRQLAAYRKTTEAWFDHGDGHTYRIDPELVILGGDISEDRNTGIDTDLPIWMPLYQAGIVFIAGFGNHDWDPAFWSDGPGYSLAGHLSNESTKEFTRETYRLSAQLNAEFDYTELPPTSSHGPVTFHATYRGIQIANFNTFPFQPSYYYPADWPLSCNLLGGGAGCQTFVSAEAQIAAMEQLLAAEPAAPALFVEHYPITTGAGWWDDYGASGTDSTEQQDRLLSMMAARSDAVLLAGHNHVSSERTHAYGGKVLREYVAPYFGGTNGVDPSLGGGFLAVLVSPTRGILEVKTIEGGAP